jgi:putative nucleotidyltransferase with HDIG domain
MGLSRRSPTVLLIAIVVLTGVVGFRYYNEPKLAPGKPAPETIKAPITKRIEDLTQTQAARDEARDQAQIIFAVNPDVNAAIEADWGRRIAHASTLRQLAGPLPFVSPTVLTLPTQRSLRALPAHQLNQVLTQVDRLGPGPPPKTINLAPAIWEQLRNYRQRHGQDGQWEQLQQKIETAQRQFQVAQSNASLPFTAGERSQLLALSDGDWQTAKPLFQKTLNEILVQGIPYGLPEGILARTIQVHLATTSIETQGVGQTLLMPILQPNLTADRLRTKLEQDAQIKQVQPVYVSVQAGDVIVTKGDKITPSQFVILDSYDLSRREVNWIGLAWSLAGVLLAIQVFRMVQRKTRIPMSRRDYLLVLLLAMSAPLLVVVSRLEFTSLPAVGLLVSTFYGSLLGGTVVILVTLLMLLGLEMGMGQLAAIAIGSLVGSLFARQPRSRDELALLGLIVALVQGLVYFLILSATGGVWYVVVGAAIRQGVLGLLWTIATLGISPYLEHLFDLVTPIRLAELANPNRPLLKRLAMESPGTFQHTLLVATLAEAGARVLGCNVELVRTGTLYHDIGKLHDPQAFIENQFGIENVHDTLDNPWESADIIKKHVTEGLVMARRARLPSAVQAFIPEHQGKILIAFFHHQAQKKAEEQSVTREVLEADFRYEGPIPQSRETGIVMLADACEAALRSLKDATPEVARRTINKIFKARWEDQQLVDSGLSRVDLTRLEDVFIEVWQQFHHKRVSYPNRLLNR